jgi:hypothetical protein
MSKERLNEATPDIEDKEEIKRIKLEKEKQELIHNLKTNNFDNLRAKVAYILNNNMATRNSDIELCWQYWTTYHSAIFNGQTLTKEVMLGLPKISSITRERAKIQNQYNLFQANDEVKKHRGKLEEKYRDSALEDRPTGLPIYSVYIDETGKNEKYLSVGSLWILDAFSATGASEALKEWKKRQNIDCNYSAFLNNNELQ